MHLAARLPLSLGIALVCLATACASSDDGASAEDEGVAALSGFGRAARIIGARALDSSAANKTIGPLEDGPLNPSRSRARTTSACSQRTASRAR